MREHKFRALYDGEWHYFTLAGLSVAGEGEYYWLDNPDTIVCEFTGLLDKNGVEIYEGDIFSAWDNRSYYIVEWNEQSAGFHLVWTKGAIGDSKSYHYFEMLMAEYQFESVGNIYENPELPDDYYKLDGDFRPNGPTK